MDDTKKKISSSQEEKPTNGKAKIVITIVAGLVVILGAVTLYLYFSKDEAGDNKGAIVITEDTRNGNSEMMDRVAEGMIAVKMTGVWTFKNGNAAGDGYVANSQHNGAPLKITVQLKETEETVLVVDSIPVGSCVENFALQKELEKGTYPAIVTHSTLDGDGNVTNSVRTEIQINVLN